MPEAARRSRRVALRRSFRWTLLFLAVWPIPARCAQTAQYFFDVFSPDSGLPQTNVTTALQTHDGYLWVGTEGGLGRFDGVRFVNWHKSTVPQLVNHSIRCLFEDRDRALWIGTEDGVVRYRHGEFARMGLDRCVVTAIAQDRAGALWFGTAGQGVHALQDGTLKPVVTDELPRASAVQCLYLDSSGQLWVGLKNVPGVVVNSASGWKRFTGGGRITGETNAVCEWPAGIVWLGNAHGLFRMEREGGNLTYYGKSEGLTSMQIRDLAPSRQGGLWVAAGGLHHISLEGPGGFACTPILNASVRNIHRFFQDRENNMWLCAMAEGLVRVRRAPFQTVAGATDPDNPVVKAVSEDSAGNLWVALQRSNIARIGADGAVRRLSIADGLPAANPLSVCAASDGTIWIGYSSALCAWRNGEVEVNRQLDGVSAIFEDAEGTVWFGAPDGATSYDRGNGFRKLHFEPLRSSSVYAFASDASGAVYIGHAAGVIKVRGKKLETIGGRSDLATGPVRALHVDRDNRLWVGMKGRGLGVWVDGAWMNPDTLAQCVSDHVSAIADVGDGRLWLGTPSGVMWAEKADLLAVARGDRVSPRMRVAGEGDGARIMPVSSGAQPAVWTTWGGEMLFATRRGLMRVDPRDVRTNAVPPNVQIEQVTIDGRPGGLPSLVQIPAGGQSVTFDYTAPSFVNPARVQFHYRLEGYDKDWVHAGARRTAYYTNLPPGSYVFRVKASNSDGVGSERSAELAVVQRPHFYQTWWFFSAAGIALVSAAVGANRWSHRRLSYRVALLEEKEAADRDRRRIAKDLHDDIGASLTEIGLVAQSLKNRSGREPEIATMANHLAVRVHRVTAALDAVVWAVNPANDSLDRLAGFIVETFQDFLRHTPIRCRLDVSREFPSLALVPEERSHLFLTAKEAINNVVKHSGATEAWLRLAYADGVLTLSIEDNGRGFDFASAAGQGNGLANMRARVEELGGALELETAPGGGTNLTVRVALRAKTVDQTPSLSAV